jgi:hypothetical protein
VYEAITSSEFNRILEFYWKVSGTKEIIQVKHFPSRLNNLGKDFYCTFNINGTFSALIISTRGTKHILVK